MLFLKTLLLLKEDDGAGKKKEDVSVFGKCFENTSDTIQCSPHDETCCFRDTERDEASNHFNFGFDVINQVSQFFFLLEKHYNNNVISRDNEKKKTSTELGGFFVVFLFEPRGNNEKKPSRE